MKVALSLCAVAIAVFLTLAFAKGCSYGAGLLWCAWLVKFF